MRSKAYLCIVAFFLAYMPLCAQFAGGTGSVSDPYLVETPSQLNEIRYHRSAHFRQNDEIYLEGSPYTEGNGWIPLGSTASPFTGSYDGNGFKIWDLISYQPVGYMSLFGVALNARLENVSFERADMHSDWQVSILVGKVTNCTVYNCSVYNSSVNGFDFTGGLISDAYDSEISGCIVEVDIIARESVAGIVAYLSGSQLVDCHVRQTHIQGTYQDGGIVGTSVGNSLIEACSFSGTINSFSETGAIAGWAEYTQIVDCSSSDGLIAGGLDCGGIIGEAFACVDIINCSSSISVFASYNVGGLIGLMTTYSTAQNSYASGSVSGGNRVGGFVGRLSNSSISNCYSSGSVNGAMETGGFAGKIMEDGSFLQNCYSIGHVNCRDEIPGGFSGAGSNNSAVHCYWDMESSQCATSSSGEGRTTYQMTCQTDEDTYLGWDFESIWTWLDGPFDIYPGLNPLPVSTDDPYAPAITHAAINVYPNPSLGNVRIGFDLKEPGTCQLRIYDIRGRLVRELQKSSLKAGQHEIAFDGRDDLGKQLSSGHYLLLLESQDKKLRQRLTIIK